MNVCRMYLDPSLSLQERWMVTMMIYGAQSDKFDYHYVRLYVCTYVNVREMYVYVYGPNRIYLLYVCMYFCVKVVQLQESISVSFSAFIFA